MIFLWANLNSYHAYSVEFCFLEGDSYIKDSPVIFNTRFGPFTNIILWMSDVHDSNRVFNTMDCAVGIRV